MVINFLIISKYNTIAEPSEFLFKDKGSKFIGFVFPVANEVKFKTELNVIKELHPSATHHCYAFRLGVNGETYRFSDDGEPSGSAGKPIYGQLLSFDVTFVGAVVVRYYGGTKLGVGGLINAYRSAIQSALEENEIISKSPQQLFSITFSYDQTNLVQQILHGFNYTETSSDYDVQCYKIISCDVDLTDEVTETFKAANIAIKPIQ